MSISRTPLSLLFGLVCLFCLMPLHGVSAAPQGTLLQSPEENRQALARPDVDQLGQHLVPTGQNQVPALVLQDRLSLLPYLQYCIDSTFALDIDNAAGDQQRDKYELFVPDRMPIMGAPGITWMRFVLAPVQEGTVPPRLLLDTGRSVPASPLLYTPTFNNGVFEWKETTAFNNRIELPAQGSVPIVCYLRLDGIPGYWFAPTVQTVTSSLEHPEFPWYWAQLIVLIVVICFCLLKGLVEPGQWRLWALLYLAACTTQAWAGMVPVTAGYSPKILASLTTAGLALMLWPHVARHFMRCREVSRALDAQFILLCLPGAALTLLPLVPNLQWTARVAQIWPLAMLVFVPGALWACIVGAHSAGRFLVSTFLPPLATAAGLMGMRVGSGFDPELLASLPHFGVALGALVLLALERRDQTATASPQFVQQSAPRSLSLDLAPEAPEPEPAILLEEAVDDDRDSSYGFVLTPLGKVQEKLKDLFDDERFPASCRGNSQKLLDAVQNLADELLRLEEEDARAKENARKMTVVAVSRNTAFLAVLQHVLRPRNCYFRVAGSLEDAVEKSRELAARLYVFEGEFATPASSATLGELRDICRKAGVPTHFLAYTPDDSTWQALGAAGFTHALVLPIDDTALYNTLDEFLREDEEAQAAPVTPVVSADTDRDETGPEQEQKQEQKQEIEEIPDLFGFGSSGTSSAGRSQTGDTFDSRTGRELVQHVSLAKLAFVRGDMQELVRQISLVCDKAAKVQPVARMAQLVLTAASSKDNAAVRDLLSQLAHSVESRLQG